MKEYSVKSFICWFNEKKKLIAVILLAATVGFGVLSYFLNHRPAADPIPMDVENSSIDDYAYVDAIGVSGWVYQVGRDTTYYIVMDKNHYSYVVRILDKDIDQYTQQNRWFEGYTDEEIPVCIAGRVKKMNSAVKQAFMEALEIDADEFDSYFGSRMLWAGETPSGAAGTTFVFLAVLTGAAALALLLSALAKTSVEKAAMKRLEERELMEQAEQVLNAPETQSLKNDHFRMDDRFLFGRSMGLAAAWDDVRWCYIHRMNYNFIFTLSYSLIIYTADQKRHVMFFPGKRMDEMQELMTLFAQYNPDILLGYSMENQKAYRQSVKNP